MFLFQRFGYNTYEISDEKELEFCIETIGALEHKSFGALDTETTGLNIMKDTPFLFVFGFNKEIFYIVLTKNEEFSKHAMKIIRDALAQFKRIFIHNANYDSHMMINYGLPIHEELRLADSSTLFRLTTPADMDFKDKKLETIGSAFVHSDAKQSQKAVKLILQQIDKERKAHVYALYKDTFLDKRKTTYTGVPFGKVWAAYHKQVQYVANELQVYFDFIDEHYTKPNWLDVYNHSPLLMIYYAIDDVVIVLEYVRKATPVLMKTDPQFKVFNRECALIPVGVEMERVGFKADIDYLLECRRKVLEYKDVRQAKLDELGGEPVSVYGQTSLKKLFAGRFGVPLTSTSEQALTELASPSEAVREFIGIILELRTVEKWLSTYIDGKLNRITNGRIYTSIDNAGAVSGRVSSDMQQQPKGGLYTKDGEELFHPRKCIIADDDYYIVSMDFSQQELRVTAQYTIDIAGGDLNLCRAYIPFNCYAFDNDFNRLEFDPSDPALLKSFEDFEWLKNEDDTLWTPVDVHTETTLKAFPEAAELMKFPEGTPEFKRFNALRKFGKMCNFLKNYGGGKSAIQSQIKDENGQQLSDEIVSTLDKAYYEAFPAIRRYQNWVNSFATKYGYVENYYGRRYYMTNPQWFYKLGNYLIQGGSADMVKTIEIKISNFLKTNGFESKMLMPIHDEILFLIKKDEAKTLIPKLNALMVDTPEIKNIPMKSDIEFTETSWAEMKSWRE